jgi:hypothetical protein
VRTWATKASPFFWGVLAMLAPAALAAAVAGSAAPGYALGSQWVRRLQIGLAVFAGLYVIVLVLWLSYQGRSIQRAELPGGAGVNLPDPDLNAAAMDFEDYKAKTTARITALEEGLEVLKKTPDDG